MGNPQTTRESFVFIAPPSMPILPGATTPQSKPGATTWSTLVDAELVWTGTSWQYPGRKNTLEITTLTEGRQLIFEDAFRYLRVTSQDDVMLTIPTHATLPFDVGTYITGVQAADGGIAFVPAAGVVLNVATTFVTADHVATRTKFSGFNLVKVAMDEWDIAGDIISKP